MKCDICGKKIYMKEKRLDGLPVAVGFELEDGRIINVCTECVMEGKYDTDKGICKDNTMPVLL